MNKTNIIVGAIAVIALIVGGIAFLRGPSSSTSSSVASTQNYGNTSIDGSQSNLPNPSNSDYSVARLAQGFGTNLSVNSGVGNINVEAQAQNMVAGTTTVCTIQNPFNATSTIMSVTANLKTGISGGATFALGTTTSGTATSTGLATTAFGTFVGGLITWDPSVNNAYLAPLGQITLGFTGGSATGTPFTINGTCSALLESVD
jgi:hypothetical protein